MGRLLRQAPRDCPAGSGSWYPSMESPISVDLWQGERKLPLLLSMVLVSGPWIPDRGRE